MSILNNIVYYYANPAISFLTLAGLVAIWAYTHKIPSIKTILGFIYLNIFVMICRAVYCTYANYWIWKHNPQFKIFLEPEYFFKFSFNNYWLVALATLFFGFLFFKLIVFLNTKFDNRFFYDQEPYLIFLGIIINPWPMLFFFILSSIACLLILQVLNLVIQIFNLKNTKTELTRIPMLYIWIPAMLLSLFIYFVIFSDMFPNIKSLITANWFIKTLFENFFIFR